MSVLSKLDSPPSVSEDFTNTDYIEILCLVQIELAISQIDVLDRFSEAEDLDLSIDLDAAFQNSGREEVGGKSSTEKKDRKWKQIQSWFEHLSYRKRIFGDNYPFELDDDHTVVRRKENLTPKQRLYIFLLISASLRHLTAKRHQTLVADSFEIVCYEALKRYLPDNAEVHLFGSNLYNQGQFKGKKADKIKALAEQLLAPVLFSESDFADSDTGDGGLDIVAWIPFDDQREGNLLLFAQCACGTEWENKQSSSSFETWNSHIHFTAYPSNMFFIPHCFITSDGRWYQKHRIKMTILVDRLRLINMLSTIDAPDRIIPEEIQVLLEQVIEYREPLI